MTPEQQRKAIAEWCGWEGVVGETGYTKDEKWSKCCPHFTHSGERKEWWFASLPNYLNDLNAMHEAEKGLSEHQARDYAHYKLLAVAGDVARPMAYRKAIMSTAAQRAEALLRTIGKWVET